AEWLALLHNGQVAVGDVVPVEDHHVATANDLQVLTTGDHHAGVLAQSDAQAVGVAGHRLCEAAEAAPGHEVGVDDHIVHQAQSGGHLHSALEQTGAAVALIDHGAAHAHGTGAGAGDHEVGLLTVPTLHHLQELGASEDGGEAELVAATDHHPAGLLQALHHVGGHILAVADAEVVHLLHAQLAEGLDVVLGHLVGDAAGAGDQRDALIGAAVRVHHPTQDAALDEVVAVDVVAVPALGLPAFVLV